MSLRLTYLAVLQVFGWLGLLTPDPGDQGLEILILRHQVAVLQLQVETPRFVKNDLTVGLRRHLLVLRDR
jgi:putative transposase